MKTIFLAVVLLCASSPACALEVINFPVTSGRLCFSILKSSQSGIGCIDFAKKSMEVVVPPNGINEYPAISPDGKRVAFYSDRSGSRQIHLLSFSDSGVEQVTYAPGGNEDPTWSPDGKKLIISRGTGKDEMNLFEIDLETKVEHQLTSTHAKSTVPKISRDGKSILYSTSAHWPGWDIEMYRAGKSEQLTSGLSTYCRANWNPAGTGFAYSYGMRNEIDLWYREGEREKQLTDRPGKEYDAEWTSDGRKLFFTGELTPGKGDFQLFLLDVSDGAIVQVTKGEESVRYLSFAQ